MNARLYIAAHALQGLLAHGECEHVHPCTAMSSQCDTNASIAVRSADALIAELRKTSPAGEVDRARLEGALLHATSGCNGGGPMEMRGGETYEPPCEECKEVAEVVAELRKRQEAQRA